jgi:hypothetical protein
MTCKRTMPQVAGAGASQSAASAQCGTCAEAAETRLAVRELLQQQLMQVRLTPHTHTHTHTSCLWCAHDDPPRRHTEQCCTTNADPDAAGLDGSWRPQACTPDHQHFEGQGCEARGAHEGGGRPLFQLVQSFPNPSRDDQRHGALLLWPSMRTHVRQCSHFGQPRLPFVPVQAGHYLRERQRSTYTGREIIMLPAASPAEAFSAFDAGAHGRLPRRP